MDIAGKTIINIISAPRSGSTMLDVMLGSGEAGCSLGESVFYFRPIRKHDGVLDCSCGEKNCSFWKALMPLSVKKFHQSALEQAGCDYVVDSSKNLNWVVDGYRFNPEVRIVNVVIWKNLEDLAYSHWKRDEDYRPNFEKFRSYYRRFFSLNVPFVSVELSELSRNPRSVLEKLCAVIGIGFDEQMLSFWEQEHHFLFGSYGVRQQVKLREACIYKEDERPLEFASIKPDIARRIQEDDVMSTIVERLKDADVSVPGNIDFQGKAPVCPYPAWYYCRKVGRALKQVVRSEHKIKNVNYIHGKKS